MRHKIQKANPDKPFRPEGIPSFLFGFISTLQRAKVQKLEARQSILERDTSILSWTYKNQKFTLFPLRVYSNLPEDAELISIWNETEQIWELRQKKLEDLFTWLKYVETRRWRIAKC